MATDTTWALDETGDWAESAGRPVHVSGRQATVQRVRVHLLRFLGEWFWDTSLGVPWFEFVLGQRSPNMRVVKALLVREIERVSGVLRVQELTLTLDTERQLSISAEVVIVDSDEPLIEVEVTVMPPTPESALVDVIPGIQTGVTVTQMTDSEPGYIAGVSLS